MIAKFTKSNSDKLTPLEVKTNDKIKGYVRFCEQLKRDNPTSTKRGAHESRFELFDDNPKISTSYKYILSSNLGKFLL